MDFNVVETEPGNPYQLLRWRSPRGRWEISCDLTASGSVRVHLSPLVDARGTYLRYYCCGPSNLVAGFVARFLIRALRDVPEETTAAAVDLMLPEHTVRDGQLLRPIKRDQQLFRRLGELAGGEARSVDLLWSIVEGLQEPEWYGSLLFAGSSKEGA